MGTIIRNMLFLSYFNYVVAVFIALQWIELYSVIVAFAGHVK